jgi:hypothetical protein
MRRNRNAPPEMPKEPTPDLVPSQKLLLSEMRRLMRVNTDTGPKDITIENGLILQLIQVALKRGSPHALGHVMRLLQEAQKQEAKRIAEDVARGRARRERALEELKHWTAAGKDPIMFVLHPDDIVITEGVGWDIKGPVDQDDLAEVLKRRDERDAFYVQARLEERLATSQEWLKAGEEIKDQLGSTCLFMMHLIDGTLPKRFCLSAHDLFVFDRTCNRKTKRELLKHTVAVWRKLGKRMPRGSRFPALNGMLPIMHPICGAAGVMLSREEASKPMTLEEITREMEAQML